MALIVGSLVRSTTETKPWLWMLTAVLVCLPIVGMAQFIAHNRVDEYDAWLFAHYGRQLLGGAELYSELWDNKPPLIFWLNTLGLRLSGGSLWGVWLLCGMAVAAALAVLYAVARRLYGDSVACMSVVLAAVFMYLGQYHVGSNRPSTFFVVTELATIGLYCLAASRLPRSKLFFMTGLVAGVGVCLKQSALAAMAAVLVHTVYLACTRRIEWRSALGRITLMLAGWLFTVGVCVLAILLTSEPAAAWDAIVGFNRLYFKPGAGASLVPEFSWIRSHLRHMGLPLILAIATGVYYVARGRKEQGAVEQEHKRPAGLLGMLWVWLMAGVTLAALGPHRRDHYLAIALPPLMLLCAHAVWLLVSSGRAYPSGRPAFHVIVGVVWLVYMLVDPVYSQVDLLARQYYHRFEAPPDMRERRILESIEQYSDENEAVFIHGYRPDLYFKAKRRSAIRFIGTEKVAQLGESGQPVWNETVAALQEAQPVLIMLDGVSPQKSGSVQEVDTTEYARWLQANYHQPDPENRPRLWMLRAD